MIYHVSATFEKTIKPRAKPAVDWILYLFRESVQESSELVGARVRGPVVFLKDAPYDKQYSVLLYEKSLNPPTGSPDGPIFVRWLIVNLNKGFSRENENGTVIAPFVSPANLLLDGTANKTTKYVATLIEQTHPDLEQIGDVVRDFNGVEDILPQLGTPIASISFTVDNSVVLTEYERFITPQ